MACGEGRREEKRLGNMEMGGGEGKEEMGGEKREGDMRGKWMSPPMSEADRRRCRCVTHFTNACS